MLNFMIAQLRVFGNGKEDGVIKFTDGLNLIQGRSNTGKTWILKSIYYLFGSDKRPYSPLTGYTDIEGIFLTRRYGRITITRKLGEQVARVNSENDKIENGEYATNYQNEFPRYLNDLWLRIIGLEETIEVPKSARYARERMSWTNIANVFFVDEDEIDKSKSIVLRDSSYDTSLIASLYFLLTGDYKKGIQEITKPEVAKANTKVILNYINEQIASFTKKRVDYTRQLEGFSGIDVERQMRELSKHICETQEEIKDLIEENTSIVEQLTEYQQEDANCGVLLDRYESLVSQYKADLQRLDFISKGEAVVKKLSPNDICPFCGGKIHQDDNGDYSNAIDAEIKRIASELAVIAATEKSLADEQESLRQNIKELHTRRTEIYKSLDEKNHIIKDYQDGLFTFKDYTTLQNGIDFVNEQLVTLGEKKADTLKKKKKTPLYHAKKEFKEKVGTGFDDLLNKILKECNYHSGEYVSWDFSTFDICMDGIPKSEYQGKGYRSFLNSVIGLMLYEYFNQDSVFIKPGFLMIDTPLLGVDENEDGFKGETVRIGLYQYFLNHYGKGQVIIVDNLSEIPEGIDFKKYNVNVVTYYKDENRAHTYGFMPSWRKDIPKELS